MNTPVERCAGRLHILDDIGLGFGMTKRERLSDQWVDLFKNWLTAHGYLPRSGKIGGPSPISKDDLGLGLVVDRQCRRRRSTVGIGDLRLAEIVPDCQNRGHP
jgi:hypothetical protein